MSPFSPVVLGAGALVVSPAIWDFAVEQSLPLDQALTRYLIAVAICWVLLSCLTELAFKPAPATPDATPDGADDTALMDTRTAEDPVT